MKTVSSNGRLRCVAWATWVTLCSTSMALAQVENIEPNPTQPYDIDTDFGYGPTNSGAHIGRGPTRPGQPREENPAETMLREIEGTNYGHYTGHVLTSTLPGGRDANRWRYRFYRGRWWYWTRARRWDYFDGRRWRPYTPSETAQMRSRSAVRARRLPHATNGWLPKPN